MIHPKHTPGPWVVTPHRTIHTPKGCITDPIWSCHGAEEGDANAVLMAAAPDLLSILKTIKAHASDLLPESINQEIDRVIAKAEQPL